MKNAINADRYFKIQNKLIKQLQTNCTDVVQNTWLVGFRPFFEFLKLKFSDLFIMNSDIYLLKWILYRNKEIVCKISNN